MGHADEVWTSLVTTHGLIDYRASELASWWHTDADLGREVETFADMSKSRALRFLDFQDSTTSFLDLFDRLRGGRVSPASTRFRWLCAQSVSSPEPTRGSAGPSPFSWLEKATRFKAPSEIQSERPS
jgi:hypothetical protein